jgi:hypothetical protein
MPAANTVTTSLSIQPFTSSEAGAWSNSYLITSGSAAILFDVFMLHSDAVRIDGIQKCGDFPCTPRSLYGIGRDHGALS